MTLRPLINLAMGLILALAPRVAVVGSHGVLFTQNERQKPSRVISQAGYNRALDILFPRDTYSRDQTTRTVFALILRFKPSFRPETQIVIKRKLDGVEVVEYTSLDGNIYSKLNDALARAGYEDAAVEMAKLIRVRRRMVEVPERRVKQWHKDFLNSMGDSAKALKRRSRQFDKDGTLTVAVDGTFYDLWYEPGVDEMSFSVYDEEVDDLHPTGDLRLVRWMNAVRLEIGKLAR